MAPASVLLEAHQEIVAAMRRQLQVAREGAGILLPGPTVRALEAAERELVRIDAHGLEWEQALDESLEREREANAG